MDCSLKNKYVKLQVNQSFIVATCPILYKLIEINIIGDYFSLTN